MTISSLCHRKKCLPQKDVSVTERYFCHRKKCLSQKDVSVTERSVCIKKVSLSLSRIRQKKFTHFHGRFDDFLFEITEENCFVEPCPSPPSSPVTGRHPALHLLHGYSPPTPLLLTATSQLLGVKGQRRFRPFPTNTWYSCYF